MGGDIRTSRAYLRVTRTLDDVIMRSYKFAGTIMLNTSWARVAFAHTIALIQPCRHLPTARAHMYHAEIEMTA